MRSKQIHNGQYEVQTMRMLASYSTDCGPYRKINQDSLGILEARTGKGMAGLAVVCDGLGGYQGGELASKYAVEKFAHWFRYRLPVILRDGGLLEESILADWKTLLRNINAELYQYGQKRQERLVTTATAVLLLDGGWYMAHVGDSRLYRVTDSRTEQLSEDQSLVARELAEHRITREQAKSDRRRNILLQCLGVTRSVTPVLRTGVCREDAMFFLCSDGLWHGLESEVLRLELRPSDFTDETKLRERLEKMTQQARNGGERDNITAAAIKAVI